MIQEFPVHAPETPDGSPGASPAAEVVTSAADDAGGSFPIAGIGASAGGLEAFTALITALVPDSGMAFVVVSHLDPVHPSALAEILARSTRIPVTDIVDGQAIAPNTIYVLPPGQDVTIDGDRFALQARGVGALHRPIDLFFRSLAEARRHLAIGVILSGTATDGTIGVRAIKGAGGLTFAQDDSARQTGMPHSAISDGFIDYVLPPREIGVELGRIGQSPQTLRRAAASPVDEDAEVTDILRSVSRDTGVDFTNYKRGTLRRRILRRMILKRTEQLAAYAALVRGTPGEARALHDDLLIGVTSFFRDPDAFEALIHGAFRRLLERDREADLFRVWVLGCSTGEEVYSLAIALTECAESMGRTVRLQIFASDVNAASIEVARAALYPVEIAQDVPEARLSRFFVRIDDRYRVVKSLRDACIFSRHNVLTDPPFSRIDFVSCRNLLMYLEPVLQAAVIGNLHYALKPDGVLWLGSADAIGSQSELFDTLDSQHKIFLKRAGSVSHPVLRPLTSRIPRPAGPGHDPGPQVGTSDLLRESDRILLTRFTPAGVVISPSMEVLQYRGNVGRYVSPAPGKASLSLTHVLDRRLHVPVRAALAKAMREKAIVVDEHVRLTSDDGRDEGEVTLEVVPLGPTPDGFLILLGDRAGVAQPLAPSPGNAPADAAGNAGAVMRLSKELADTQAYLREMFEEQEAARAGIEAAHEEAQSANEELQSINEELETSKEEIQSANEELTTLNDELQHRNGDLQSTNSDLNNLLVSTDLAVVFVGPGLEIRRFTFSAERLLGLRAVDVGRPLDELRINLSVDVHAQVAHTLRTLEVREQRAQSATGRWFSLRTRPYRTLDNQVDGAVIVLVDIDDLIRARQYAESIVATGRAPLIVLDERLDVVTANDAFYRVFATTTTRIERQPFFELSDGRWDVPELRRLLERVLPADHAVKDFEATIDAGDGARIWLLDAQRLRQADGGRPLIMLSMEDVTERYHADALRRQRVTELAAADRSKTEFLAMLAHELRNPLAPIRTAAQLLGAPGVPPAVSANARAIIERQTRHMTRLIDDLLDVARITQGKLSLEQAPLELTELMRRASEVVSQHISDRRQLLSLSFEPASIYVIGDATRLEQAFGNLISNASKFSQAGGQLDVRVELEPCPEGAQVVVRISDDGVGIDPSMLPHIFDLFRQGSESPHHASGLGVGLALVRRIVELHGGRVTASSEGRGLGSEFVVTLPALSDTGVVAGPGEAEREGPSTPRRILVVDDNTDAADTLVSLLRVRGHDARMVTDGQEALTLARVFQPAVVFLDIGLPGMDGYEVAQRLRHMPGGERLRLIALTGYDRPEDRQRAVEAGFDRHVTKPLDPGALQSLVAGERVDGVSH